MTGRGAAAGRRSGARRVPCPRASPRSPRPPATTPAPPRRKTPTAPTPPTGATTTPGRGGKTSLPCPRIRKFSASTSPPAPPARPARSRARSAPSSGGSRRSCGISPSAASRSDRKDRHVATVLAGIRRTQGRPPEQKEAILPEDLLAMIATLDLGDLRGLRDRAILLDRFRRRPAPLGNRRPRLPPPRTASAAAGSNFSTTDCC